MAEQSNGRIRVRWEVVATVVAWLVGGLLAYGALDGRIAVLEDRYLRMQVDLTEIKADVKVLIRREGP